MLLVTDSITPCCTRQKITGEEPDRTTNRSHHKNRIALKHKNKIATIRFVTGYKKYRTVRPIDVSSSECWIQPQLTTANKAIENVAKFE
jgi:hypothetical protein